VLFVNQDVLFDIFVLYIVQQKYMSIPEQKFPFLEFSMIYSEFLKFILKKKKSISVDYLLNSRH
jgi:hypothetical protein